MTKIIQAEYYLGNGLSVMLDELCLRPDGTKYFKHKPIHDLFGCYCAECGQIFATFDPTSKLNPLKDNGLNVLVS